MKIRTQVVRAIAAAIVVLSGSRELQANEFETSFEVLAPSTGEFFLEMGYYAGGVVSSPSAANLSRTGVRSWLVGPGESASVDLLIPVEIASLYVRHETATTTSVVNFLDANGAVVSTGTGSDTVWSQLAGGSPLMTVARISIENTGATGIVAIDDLFYAVPGPGQNFCSGDGGDGAGCTSCPCANDAPLGTTGGCMNLSGYSARLIGLGSASVSADDLEFRVSGGNEFTHGILFVGQNALPSNPSHPCASGSGLQQSQLTGLRCVGGSLRRLGSRSIWSGGIVGPTVLNPGATAWPSPHAAAPSLGDLAGFVPGETRYFQFLYRTQVSACPRDAHASDAYEVTFVP